VAAFVAVSLHTKEADPVSLVVLGVYLKSVLEQPEARIHRPQNGCPHLYYEWWESGPLIAAILYYVSTLVSFRTLPQGMFAKHAFIFLGSSLISSLLVKPCGGASVWCWSVAIVATLDLILRKKISA
jgi:hypothetical protein